MKQRTKSNKWPFRGAQAALEHKFQQVAILTAGKFLYKLLKTTQYLFPFVIQVGEKYSKQTLRLYKRTVSTGFFAELYFLCYRTAYLKRLLKLPTAIIRGPNPYKSCSHSIKCVVATICCYSFISKRNERSRCQLLSASFCCSVNSRGKICADFPIWSHLGFAGAFPLFPGWLWCLFFFFFESRVFWKNFSFRVTAIRRLSVVIIFPV